MQVHGLAVTAGGQTVQRDLDFELRRGEVLVIVGPSGCGKSTLLRHLVGLEQPAAGQVLYDGHDLHRGDEAALAALRRRFGVMFQAGALWSSMSRGENLVLPMRLFTTLDAAERERRARFKLALVGLDGGFELMPAQLSGGMRKRAALARALALDPELLFLDEPTAGLDPESAGGVDELVLKLRDLFGLTVVMITHDLDLLWRVADRVAVLAAGKVQGIGSMSELARLDNPAIRQFFDGPRGRAAQEQAQQSEAPHAGGEREKPSSKRK